MSAFEEHESEDRRRATGADGALISLVRLVQTTDAQIGLTLTIGGLVLTGRLVSSLKWFELIGEQRASGEAAHAFLKVFREAGKEKISTLRADYKELEQHGTIGELAPPTFIHLANAQMLTGGGLQPGDGMLWRGRVDRIDGWAFGSMSTG